MRLQGSLTRLGAVICREEEGSRFLEKWASVHRCSVVGSRKTSGEKSKCLTLVLTKLQKHVRARWLACVIAERERWAL
jgi:hypothetical protein